MAGSNERWKKIKTNTLSDRRKTVGPAELEAHLPELFEATMTSADTDLQVNVKCRFDGTRVEVVGLTLDGRAISPADLLHVHLDDVVRTAAEALDSARNLAFVGRRLNRKPQGEELAWVAGVYAWNHATWGADARQAVARTFGLKPSTASYWLRKAAEAGHSLPGRES